MSKKSVTIVGSSDSIDEPITVTIETVTGSDGIEYTPVVAYNTPVPQGSHKVTVTAKPVDETVFGFIEDLRIARQYDREVSTYAALVDRIKNTPDTLVLNQRIMVREDENYSNFWTIWRYAPGDEAANNVGLVLEDIQRFRTTDFFNVVDWYEAGYSPRQPPLRTYPDYATRNSYEGPTPPANTLVKITDDGSGKWAWTLFDGSGWVVVARQSSTIEFKSTFYDETRAVFGLDTLNLDDIGNRDGSWEIRAIFNQLRTKILNNSQLNELFFSMLHFFHSQQDEVNWAFKTSFMNIIGFNSHLNQTPIQYYDTTQNLLDYVEEVKPYHVKLRDFRRVLTPDVDKVDMVATDFDKPPYFDPDLGRYRRLNPAIPEDMDIMKVTNPQLYWYLNYTKPDNYDPTSMQWNPIRKINIRIAFDRVDPVLLDSGGGWDIPPWDIIGWDGDETYGESFGSALARILMFYEPGPNMIQKEALGELMDGMDFRGTVVDGADIKVLTQDGSEWDIRPYDTEVADQQVSVDKDSIVEGLPGVPVQVTMNDDLDFLGLRDPKHLPGHPEEFVPVQGNEAITFTVHTERSAGAPNHYVTHLRTARTRRNTVEIPYHGEASSAQAVMVFAGGKRAVYGRDYTIDFTNGSISMTLGRPRPETVMVHALGIAGLTRVVEYSTFTGDGATKTFSFNAMPAGYVEVVVDGVRQDPATLARSGLSVTLQSPPGPNQHVVLVAYEAGTPNATHVHTDVLAWNQPQEWTLPNRTYNPAPALEFMGTIVEVDGLRLTPPHASRVLITSQQYVEFKPIGNLANLKFWADSVPYGKPVMMADYNQFDTTDPALAQGIYFFGNTEFYVNDPDLIGKVLTFALYENYDYNASDGVLKIYRGIDPNSRIEVTTFENPSLMGVETYTFDGNAEAVYKVPAKLASESFCLISVNGVYLTVEVDYALSGYRDIGWDIPKWDKLAWGGDKQSFLGQSLLTIPGGQNATDKVVITVFRGAVASEPSTWGMVSAKNSTSMMADPKLCSEWGYVPFDFAPAEVPVPLKVSTVNGDRILYRMNESWEVFKWGIDDPAHEPFAVHLAKDLYVDDEQIFLTVPADGSTDDVRIGVPNTDANTPGVILINGERIEYFSMVSDSDTSLVLSQLRRGTRATRLSTEVRRTARYTGDGANRLFGLPGGIQAVPEIRLTSADGRWRHHLQVGIDFSFTVDDAGLTATLFAPPAPGIVVTIGQDFPVTEDGTNRPVHPKGSVVRNVTVPDRHPVRAPFRIREDLTDINLYGARGYIVDIYNFEDKLNCIQQDI